ncbi:MAG: hypothetical protein ACOYNS_11655 [Bacteroidota bacterium]
MIINGSIVHMKKKILFICGSRNQTTQMHQISQHLADEYDCFFTPYYASGHVEFMRRIGLTEMTIMSRRFTERCLHYLEEHGLTVDLRGEEHHYDLVLTCADLVVPKNIRKNKIILVQEGMTDPENWAYHLVKLHLMPRWCASTAAMGLSDAYVKFCVASDGYKELFIGKGVMPEKLIVTGIPNFDHCVQYLNNTFPHKNFVLVCTSDSRETVKLENRKAIILDAVKKANGRLLIFKLHPNENVQRATAEIAKYAPDALVFSSGSAEEMIANCDVLITQFSSTVYVGLALGKEVYSNFPVEMLKRLTPLQNNCAARNIADVCRQVIDLPHTNILHFTPTKSGRLKEFFRTNSSTGFLKIFPQTP